MTSKVTYLGDLRTSSIHLNSGTEVLSDAPLDNNGKGEAFSPTDSVANALATCMFTIMAIKAQTMDVEMKCSTAEMTKHMQANPRRIAKIEITFNMTGVTDAKTQEILKRTSFTCPVYLSLHPDVEKAITFNWKS